MKKAIEFFKELKNSHRANLQLWTINDPPVFTMYRFDNSIIVALFKHRKSKVLGVPAFICEEGGTLYNYYRDEYEDLVKRGQQIIH